MFFFPRMIQFSSHYFGQVPRLASRYCRIQQQLGRTHQRVYGQSWGWERWDRRP